MRYPSLLLTVAAVATLFITAGCGSQQSASRPSTTVTSATTTQASKPKPKPRGYGYFLQSSLTTKTAAKTSCTPFAAFLDSASRQETSELSELQRLVDPYTAADYVASHVITQTHLTDFRRSFLALARQRLTPLMRHKLPTPTMVQVYSRDALFVCGLGSSYRSVYATASTVDDEGGAVQELAAEKPWYPPDYRPWEGDETVAWMWDDNPTCDYDGASCWGIYVIAQNGCTGGVYAELNISEGENGPVVDYSNDTVPHLDAGQVARLTFNEFDLPEGARGQITEIRCSNW